MSEQIDYRAEVLKVYPDAFITYHVTEGQLCGWVIRTSCMSFSDIISDINRPKSQAWQSAYETLKQHGKL